MGVVVFGAIMVAPVTEEVLFRGLLLGSLLRRGSSPLLAGGMTILAFRLRRVALLGIAGLISTAASAVFPTYLSLRYNNLTGA